jgi:hypothetical protein
VGLGLGGVAQVTEHLPGLSSVPSTEKKKKKESLVFIKRAILLKVLKSINALW